MTDAVIDREQAFVLFTTFAGDCIRTAAALGIRPVDVLKVADDEGWLSKIEPIIKMKKSAKPGDFDRAMNRALNFAQSHRMRLIVERVIHRLMKMDNEELRDHLSARDKLGNRMNTFSFRALADLATALEKAQSMSYQALSDTVQDRTRRQEQETGDGGAGDLNEKIAAAMAAVGASESPRAQLLDAQLEIAENARVELAKPIVIAPEPPGNPHDNDDH